MTPPPAQVKKHAFVFAVPIHSSRIGRGGKPPRGCLSCVALPDTITRMGLDRAQLS